MTKFTGMLLGGIEAPQKMPLLHPVTQLPLKVKATEEGAEDRDAFIMVLSSEGSKARAFDRQMTDKRLSNTRKKITAEELEAETRLKFAKLIAAGGSWLLCDLEGNEIDVVCNETNALELLSSASWVLEQVVDFSNNRTHFVKS